MIGESPPELNLLDYEALARERLSAMAFEYIAAGSADEHTLRRNCHAYTEIRLRPRVLIDVSELDTRVELFGQVFEHPVLLAPTAFHRVLHPQGELAVAEGAAASASTFVVSTFATTSLEEIARAVPGRQWFQFFISRDRGFTRDLLQRAEGAGYQALCLTVDTPVIGTRDRERRHRFRLPPGVERENFKGLADYAALVDEANRNRTPGNRSIYSAFVDPSVTWDTLEWLRSFVHVPLVVKGLLTPEDAQLAVDHGAQGVIVSNHGARNLDTVPATIEVLPDVVAAVEGRVPVLVDGGIRRGTDVLKALALGARAVLIGRPYLWGLAVNGADGVRMVVDLLRTELEAAMALCGARSLAELNRRFLWPQSTPRGQR